MGRKGAEIEQDEIEAGGHVKGEEGGEMVDVSGVKMSLQSIKDIKIAMLLGDWVVVDEYDCKNAQGSKIVSSILSGEAGAAFGGGGGQQQGVGEGADGI